MMNFNAINKYCVVFTTAENETSKEGHTCLVAFGDFVEWSIIHDVVSRFWSRVAVVTCPRRRRFTLSQSLFH